MKVRIVCYEDLDLWILGKFALKMQQELCALGIDCDIAKVPDLKADINHHIIYYYYDGKPSTIDTVMITHIDADWKLEQVRSQMQVAQMGICMSAQTVQMLAQSGIPRERLSYVLPAHDQVMKPRPVAIGITSKVHSDGRKREIMLAQLTDFISPADFMFKIMGAGWSDIVEIMRNKGFTVEYYDAFDYELNKRLVPTFDYYLYMGLDEGAMGFIDALAAGVPTIVTPQGYHLEAQNGITHPFVTFEELVAVLKGISDQRHKLTDAVSSWTWREYALKHLEIWEYLLLGKHAANLNPSRKDGFASVVAEAPAQGIFPVKGQNPPVLPRGSKTSKKIMIACSHFWPSIGGLENRVEQFGSELVRAGYDVTVMTPDFPGRDRNIRQGIQILSINPATLIEGHSAWPYAVRKAVMSGDYDTCILIQDPLGNIIWSVEGATPHPSTRLIIQPIINADGYGKWKNHAEFSGRLAGILRGADVAVAMTKTGPETTFMRFAGISPVYLPNATKLSEPAGHFRQRYGIPEDRFVILHVANLYWVKNHCGLMDALHDLPASWLLVMIGSPSGEPECGKAVIEKLAQRPDILYIPGLSREWVASAMAEADIVVLSSLGEGAPNTILEAMAHGKAWMATPQCGAANEHAGGIICPLDHFKKNLEVLSTNRNILKSLGNVGQQHWQECLSWPKVITGWIDVIETGKLNRTFAMPPDTTDAMANIKNALLEAGGVVTKRKFVNIGMVTYNRLEFTRQAIEALAEHTAFPHTLTVIDNNSQDGTKEYLRSLESLGVIKNLVLLDENVGVAKASNLAWSLEPNAEYYLKLDNDIVIQKTGWLDHLVEVADAVPEAGAVAYNFEPASYPSSLINGIPVRVKHEGNLGGACILIPARTFRKLGYWCEDYGLYGEEDADYGSRIHHSGLLNVYMEDEGIGIHLPAGRAAKIDDFLIARDGQEEVMHASYRAWKDAVRRENILSGRFNNNIRKYADKGTFYLESQFVMEWERKHRLPDFRPIGSRQNAADKPLVIAVFTLDTQDSACPILRLISPLCSLGTSIKLIWGSTYDGNVCTTNLQAISAADILVLQRFYPRNATLSNIEYMIASGKPIVYEIDDLITALPEDNPLKPSVEETTDLLAKLMPHFNAITASTEALAAEFGCFNKTTYVLPNLIDESLWQVSPKTETSEPIVIGFAGTNSHREDMDSIGDALFMIAQKYGKRVVFRFMGDASPRMAKLPTFEFIPFTADYASYSRALGQSGFDIAVVPLVDNAFNRCKSNIKWLEYSACGIAGIYSDLPPYNTTVEHGTTGLLAGNDPQQWFDALDLLIGNTELRRSIAANARRKVLSEYTVKTGAHRWIDVYRQVIANHGKASPHVISAGAVMHSDASVAKPAVAAVSIIIPLFNRIDLTKQCLEGLAQTVGDTIPHEIILVDNGSTDGTAEYLRSVGNRVSVISNSSNQGFAKACNQGARAASGRYLLFLNNDTVPQPGWLEPLVQVLEDDPAVAAVGSKLLYPDGTIQHAGVVLVDNRAGNDPLCGEHIWRGRPADLPEANRPYRYQALTAACLLVRRTAFEAVQGFDEGYWNGYEDVDLCFKLGRKGWQLVYQPQSVVIHYESKSGPERFSRVAGNVERLHRTWLGKIAPDMVIQPDGRVEQAGSAIGPYGAEARPAPKVSIIIPLYNQAQLTKACVEAVLATAGDPGRYEVILVDNGSRDWTREYVKSLGDTVTAITNSDNVGFARACNQGAQTARGAYLLFLNNDTVPQAGWLDALLAGAGEDGADIVGGKLLYPNGRVQHAGVAFNKNGIGYHIFKNFPADAPAVNKKRLMQCVTAACFLVSRQLFMELGGFDEHFRNGFEDVDFCLRAGQAGKRVLYTPHAVVVHHEEQSEGRKQFDAQNMQRYLARWQGKVRCDDEKLYSTEGFTVQWHADGSCTIRQRAAEAARAGNRYPLVPLVGAYAETPLARLSASPRMKAVLKGYTGA